MALDSADARGMPGGPLVDVAEGHPGELLGYFTEIGDRADADTDQLRETAKHRIPVVDGPELGLGGITLDNAVVLAEVVETLARANGPVRLGKDRR